MGFISGFATQTRRTVDLAVWRSPDEERIDGRDSLGAATVDALLLSGGSASAGFGVRRVLSAGTGMARMGAALLAGAGALAAITGVRELVELAPGRSILPAPFGSPSRLDASQRAELADAARTGSGSAWNPGSDIARARNAHRTNTFDELRSALAGPYDWLEGDIRTRGGDVVMAHEAWQPHPLTLENWVTAGADSGRGLKLDFKDAAAIEPAMRALRDAKVPEERILFNVTLAGARNHRVTAEQLQRLRAEFPRATINLDPGLPPYDASCIRAAIDEARAIGGPIMFPLENGAVTREIIEAFAAVGRVAIWNSTFNDKVDDITARARELRDWGVDGMIDLR
ncbi:MAG: hypothetical protein JWN72_1492 [Thermoleophilia bacterium]|nr:hypothetical protein [Thermoleophilia bacterium]